MWYLQLKMPHIDMTKIAKHKKTLKILVIAPKYTKCQSQSYNWIKKICYQIHSFH